MTSAGDTTIAKSTWNRSARLGILRRGSRRKNSMERLMLVLVGIVTMAFAALIVTGCVVGVYWLVGLVM